VASSLDNLDTDGKPDSLFVIDTFSNKGRKPTYRCVPADPAAHRRQPRRDHAAYVVSRTQGTLTVIDFPGRGLY